MKPGPIEAYLRGLRIRATTPTTSADVEAYGLFPGFETSDDFLDEVRAAMGRLDAESKSLCHYYLFESGTAEKRGQAYAKQYDKKSNFYRLHSGDALKLLALELGKTLDKASSTAAPDRGWCHQIGSYYSLRLDPDDYRRQHWEIEVTLRALRRDQPIVEHRQDWTGVGEQEGEVVVLSGQNDEDKWIHKWLRTRPEDRLSSFAWDLYLFDLGEPLTPGDIVALRFKNTLVDSMDRFQSFVALNNVRHPHVEKLRIEIDFGPHVPSDVVRYFEMPDSTVPTGYSPMEPFEPVEVIDGRIDVTWTEFPRKGRYCVGWKPAYRRQASPVALSDQRRDS